MKSLPSSIVILGFLIGSLPILELNTAAFLNAEDSTELLLEKEEDKKKEILNLSN